MENYIHEMNSMLANAVTRMQKERPDFVIYTASIWTDFKACASAISFDSKENSLKNLALENGYLKEKYAEYMAQGDFEMAELFSQRTEIRHRNPADFELRNFEEMTHPAVPAKWKPALVKFGKFAFNEIIARLSVDRHDFELGINSAKDWYDKTWNINVMKNKSAPSSRPKT